MAGTNRAWVIPSDSINCRAATGSNSRVMIVRAPHPMPNRAQPEPAMWNSGMTAMFTLSSPICHSTISNSALKLSLVSWAPFGRPVVPDV